MAAIMSASISLEETQTSDNEEENEEITKEDITEFEKEFSERKDKKMSIMCCGPTGTGKSTLLNGLLGPEALLGKFEVGNSLECRGTSKVEERKFNKDDIEVTVWDTPGMEGVESQDRQFLDEIKGRCSEYDLFLYCINIMEARATDLFDEKSSLVKFTETFGVKLWENSVVILTKANGFQAHLEVEKELDENLNVEKKFKEKVSKWKTRVHKELRKLGVDKKHLKKLPVLPAGIAASPHLPGYDFWLGEVFQSITDQMKYDAKMAYIQLSKDRMISESDANEDSIAEQKIEDQPFVFRHKRTIAGGIIAGGVGATGAAVGASIGATIGALAIGIPSFGIAAGAGLVIGGAIGAFFGGASSIATALALKYFKQKKKNK